MGFAAVHLTVMTPARVANKQYATAGFDRHAYLADQVARFKRRLAVAEANLRLATG